jgi:hypothetical protein
LSQVNTREGALQISRSAKKQRGTIGSVASYPLEVGATGRAPDIHCASKEAVMNDNTKDTDHPEQDPAEGSRETIDRELKRQDNKAGQQAAAGKPVDQRSGTSQQK